MKVFHRAWIYGVGMLVLALGLTLNTKTGLGVSPILSLAYSGAQIWDINFGDAAFVLYCLFVAGQFLLRGRNSRWYDLLQLPLNLVFSRLLNLFDALISYDAARHGLLPNLALLLLAILVTGAGAAMTVNMRLVPNPGDGMLQALSERLGWGLGLAKNVLDVCCVAAAVVLSLAAAGRVIGVGVGTIISMVGVGRAIALTNRLFRDKMCAAAGLAGREAG